MACTRGPLVPSPKQWALGLGAAAVRWSMFWSGRRNPARAFPESNRRWKSTPGGAGSAPWLQVHWPPGRGPRASVAAQQPGETGGQVVELVGRPLVAAAGAADGVGDVVGVGVAQQVGDPPAGLQPGQPVRKPLARCPPAPLLAPPDDLL